MTGVLFVSKNNKDQMKMNAFCKRGTCAGSLLSVLFFALLLAVGARAADADPHAGHNHANENANNELAMEPKPEQPNLNGKLDFRVLEIIAIQEEGRKKPLLTYVNEMIEHVVGRPLFGNTPYLLDKKTGTKLYSMDMFLSIWLHTRDWNNIPVILVSTSSTKQLLGLKQDKDTTHYTIQELLAAPKLSELLKEGAKKIHENDGKTSTLNADEKEAQLIKRRIDIIKSIDNSRETLALVPHPTESGGTWIPLEVFLIGALPDRAREQRFAEDDIRNSAALVTKNFGKNNATVAEAAMDIQIKYAKLASAYYTRNPDQFLDASTKFADALRAIGKDVYPSAAVLGRELEYTNWRFFQIAWFFYLGTLVFGLLLFRVKSKAAFILPMVLLLIGFSIHVYGFTLRCLIAGRPPVSNMYESVLWVGFGCVFFGLVYDLIYRKKYYMLCGAGGGFFCLMLMDLVPVFSGDSAPQGFDAKINPLQPVLQSNFWLTIHVLTITLSYAAFMLAWVLGHVTLYKHLVKPAAKVEHHELHTFIYRVVQIGVLLVAIGTILGGVWAYYSWGRFWGWDPKETWAFITLLCYLVVLHGRFTGWWGNFGMSVGSVVCFQSVVMAWYGVNFVLGELGNGGLHSYGTGAGGKAWIISAVIADMIFTIVAVTRFKLYQRGLLLASPDDERLVETDPVNDARKGYSPEAAGE
jgi:cytochrome c-type biogenesis protein CcsB